MPSAVLAEINSIIFHLLFLEEETYTMWYLCHDIKLARATGALPQVTLQRE